MASQTITSQLNYTGMGPLDSKMQPVNTVEDLNKIPRLSRYKGLTVTVLNDGSGTPHDYWLKDGTGNANWVLKEMPSDTRVIDCGEY